MNEQEMKYYTDMINKKDDEIYLLNVECEELQEEVGRLKREIARITEGIREIATATWTKAAEEYDDKKDT